MTSSTVYLDWSHWSNMGRHPDAATTHEFAHAVEAGIIVPGFSPPHLYDAAQYDNDRARNSIALFMEEVSRRGDAVWVRPWDEVYKDELIAGFRQWVEGQWQPPEVLKNNRFEIFDEGHVPRPSEPTTIPQFINSIRKLEQFDEFSHWLTGYPERRELTSHVREARNQRRFTENEIRSWLGSDLPDWVSLHSGIDIPVTADRRKRFAEQAEWRDWPLTRALYALHEGWNVDPAGAEPTDVVDLFHLPGIMYCDVAFADSATVHALEVGGLDRLPLRNGEFEEWVAQL